MSDPALLVKLKELSDVDQSISRLLAERAKMQSEYDALNKQIEKLKKESAALKARSAEDKKKYEIETSRVKIEREALASRRNALATLGNYKLQQAATKEIDESERKLSEHEDTLIALLDGSEQSQKSAEDKEFALLEKEEALAEMIKDIKPTLQTLAEREGKYKAKRDELAKNIDPKVLPVYNSAWSKLAPDPLAAVKDGACDLCNYQVPAQMMIQVMQGNSIQKCRGCSRILYAEKAG